MLFPLQFKEINIKATPLGEEEISGIAEQIKYVERMSVDMCEFERFSFPRLCQEIRNRNVEVGQVINFMLFRSIHNFKRKAFSCSIIAFFYSPSITLKYQGNVSFWKLCMENLSQLFKFSSHLSPFYSFFLRY